MTSTQSVPTGLVHSGSSTSIGRIPPPPSGGGLRAQRSVAAVNLPTGGGVIEPPSPTTAAAGALVARPSPLPVKEIARSGKSSRSNSSGSTSSSSSSSSGGGGGGGSTPVRKSKHTTDVKGHDDEEDGDEGRKGRVDGLGELVRPAPLGNLDRQGSAQASSPSPSSLSMSGIHPLLDHSLSHSGESPLLRSLKKPRRHSIIDDEPGAAGSPSEPPPLSSATVVPDLHETMSLKETTIATLGYFFGLIPYQVTLAVPVCVLLLAFSFAPFFRPDGTLNVVWFWLWNKGLAGTLISVAVALALVHNMTVVPVKRVVLATVIPMLVEYVVTFSLFVFVPDFVWSGSWTYVSLLLFVRVVITIILLFKFLNVNFKYWFAFQFTAYAVVAYLFNLVFRPFFFNSSPTVRIALRLFLYPLIEKAAYLSSYFWVRNNVLTIGEFESTYAWLALYRFPFLMFGRLLTGSLGSVQAVVFVSGVMSVFKLFMRTSYHFRTHFMLTRYRGAEYAEKTMSNPNMKRFLAYNIETVMNYEKLAIAFSSVILALFYNVRHMFDIFYEPFVAPDARFLLVFFFVQLGFDYTVDLLAIILVENKVFGLVNLREKNWKTSRYWLVWSTTVFITAVGAVLAADNFLTPPVKQRCETPDYCSCVYPLAAAGDCPTSS